MSKDDNIKAIKSIMDQLIDESESLKENGYTVIGQTTGSAAEGIFEAQKKSAVDLDKLAKAKANVRASGADGWAGAKDKFHDFFAKQRVSVVEHKVDRDIKKAEKHAEHAEDNAIDALDYAYGAVIAAKVALLDAVTARSKADEIAADLS